MYTQRTQAIRAAGSAIALAYRWVVTKVLLLISPSVSVEGLIVVALNGSVAPAAIAQLRSAIRLIDAHAPLLLARLRRDVRRLMLVQTGGPEYWPFANGFILNAAFVVDSDVEFIALTIIHESTHARLWRAGVRYGPACRERIERLCVQAEASFARRLPDGEDFVEYAESKLGSRWWADEAVKERQLRAREALWPTWLTRVHRFIARA